MMAVTFRVALRRLRTERGVSRARLARSTGYSETHIAAIERGRRCNPTLAFVETMADALGVDPFDLLRG
jgi:transcriptional regulator with XRE-family HTH domain